MKSVCMLPHAVERADRPDLMRFISRAIFSLSLGSTDVGFFCRFSHSLTCQTLSIVQRNSGSASATRITSSMCRAARSRIGVRRIDETEIVMRRRRDINRLDRARGQLRLALRYRRKNQKQPENNKFTKLFITFAFNPKFCRSFGGCAAGMCGKATAFCTSLHRHLQTKN